MDITICEIPQLRNTQRNPFYDEIWDAMASADGKAIRVQFDSEKQAVRVVRAIRARARNIGLRLMCQIDGDVATIWRNSRL